MTELNHVPPTTPVEEITEHLRRDGYVIVDDLASPELMDAVEAEMAPFIEAGAAGRNPLLGKKTKRTGAMIARSPSSRKLIQDPTILGVAGSFLGHASAFQLHLTQVISIYPGETAQGLHRDQIAWDFFPFPDDYQVQCNTLWAMSPEYTKEMGATRVVPGSHLPGNSDDFTDADCLYAEMTRGSVLLYGGKILHSGGANTTEDKVRTALNITYAVGWVRQEENQFLSTPIEIAKTLDDDLLRLMGYQEGAFAMGYYRDFEDPIVAVRGDGYAPGIDIEELQGAAQKGMQQFLASST
ncbi:phytanoyl-CoA dioxygenase family protein [soil metagenome]